MMTVEDMLKLSTEDLEVELKLFFSELLVMLRLDHRYIVRYFGASVDLLLLAIFLELMEGGSLADLIYGPTEGLDMDVAL